jgi:hypothetical protein
MKRKYKKPTKPASQVAEGKVAKSYRLSPRKIALAQKVLGAPTATATIEQALDMIVFRRELIEGTRAISGLDITDAFPDSTTG